MQIRMIDASNSQDEHPQMLMKLAPKKRRNPRNFYLGIAATLLIVGGGRYFSHKAEQESAAQKAQLAATLVQLNAALPRAVDAQTTLEFIGMMYGDTIFYRYRIDMPPSSLSEEAKASMEARIRQGLEQLSCKEPQLMAAMRKFKLHQEHFYLARNTSLFSIDIRPEQLNCAS